MNESEEKAYLEGRKSVLRALLGQALRELDGDLTRERMFAERADAIATLRRLCRYHGDNEWADNLHLSDIIEKHLDFDLPETVYMVICESPGSNEPGQVLSTWADKQAALQERDRLRKGSTLGSWRYEVNDAPVNRSGTIGLN